MGQQDKPSITERLRFALKIDPLSLAGCSNPHMYLQDDAVCLNVCGEVTEGDSQIIGGDEPLVCGHVRFITGIISAFLNTRGFGRLIRLSIFTRVELVV